MLWGYRRRPGMDCALAPHPRGRRSPNTGSPIRGLQELLNDTLQILDVERLGEMPHETGFMAALHIFGLPQARQGNQGDDRAEACTDVTRDGIPINVRQTDVDQRNVRALLEDGADAIRAASRNDHL